MTRDQIVCAIDVGYSNTKFTVERCAKRVGHSADGVDIDNIIVAGGGAAFFSDDIRAAIPRHQMQHPGGGMFANLCGFHLTGEQLVEVLDQRRIETSVEA